MVDFIVRKDSVFRMLEFSRKSQIKMDDFDVWIVSPEDLIISKIEWIQKFQSAKQMEDIKILMEFRELDLPYIKHWCNQLKLKNF